uniref:Uncharacterized protein LOC114328105 n=1 Tax=Diabrotica virgifera virgifera TaxID=50390 RepID=A0A6P7FHI9_DIAVI
MFKPNKSSPPRFIVNGAKLVSHLNISILGFVTNISTQDQSMELISTDNNAIKVIKKWSGNINEIQNRFVEVHGISNGKEIIGDECIIFNNQKIDCKGYNFLSNYLKCKTV